MLSEISVAAYSTCTFYAHRGANKQIPSKT